MVSKNYYKSNIWKSYLFEFFQNLHYFAGVLIPFYTLWGGISFSQVMILQAIFTFSIFLLEVPTGAIVDKFGRKTSLVLSGLIGIIAPLVYISYANFWIFALGEVLWAMGASLASGADQAFIYDSLKQSREEKKSKKVFSRWYTISLIAIMIAGPIGSLIAGRYGLTAPMLFTSTSFLLATIVAFTYKEPPIGKKKQNKDYFKLIKESANYLRKHKILKILTFDYISIYVLSFFVVWFYQVVLQKFNVGISWFGFVGAGLLITEIIILQSNTFLEKVMGGKRKYLMLSAIIVGLAYFIIAFATNVYLALAGIFIIAGFGITRKPIYQSYFNKFIKSHQRATVLSTISMLLSLVMAMANIILGVMIDWNLKYSFIIFGVIVIVFALISKAEEKHLVD